MQIESILVLLLLLAPGLIADAIYRFLLWRPDPQEATKFTRAVLLSAAGILLLIGGTGVPPPYILSTWWAGAWQGDAPPATALVWPWLGHAAGSTLIAIAGVALMKSGWIDGLVRWVAGQSLHQSVWQEFVAANHKQWLFVKLVDGRHYYGELGVVSGGQSEGLLLWHPYPYDEDEQTYEVTGARALFVPADQVASILVPEGEGELERLRPKFGTYHLSTRERIDEQRREPEEQQHRLGAEGKPDE